MRGLTLTFMEYFFEEACQQMPNPSGNNLLWHLPCHYTKNKVYNHYQTWCQVKKLDDKVKASYQYFTKIWQDEYPFVKIPERGHFAECNV